MRSVVLVLAMLISSLPSFAQQTRYQIVTEEWAPYNYVEDGRVVGISAEVVQQIMAITKDSFPIRVLPSMRTTYVLNTEPTTIMFSLFRTPEREAKYKWVAPIVEESIFPYRLASPLPLPKTLEELRAVKRIATRIAGVVPSRMQSLGFENLDPSATESDQLYRVLFAKRADLIVGDTDLGVRYNLKRLNLDYRSVEKVPVPIFESQLFIAFSLDCADSVVASWAQALQTLKADGRWKSILLSYQ